MDEQEQMMNSLLIGPIPMVRRLPHSGNCCLADQMGYMISKVEAVEMIEKLFIFYEAVTQEELTELNRERFPQLFFDGTCEEPPPPKPPPPKSNPPKPGYVYLIRSDKGHKIGMSATPKKRITTLGVKLPFPIDVIALIKCPDMRRLEAMLHQRFEGKRINGEWFALEPADVKYIKGLQS